MSLKQRIGSLKLIPSSGGVFEVSVGEHKVYSKLKTGEFPDPQAVLKLVKARL